MKITQISHYKLPVKNYGGIQRIIEWLSKALVQLGHTVYLVSQKGTDIPGTILIPTPKNVTDYTPYIPHDTDVVHYHSTPLVFPDKPFLVTIHGNGKPDEKFLPNTVFLSRNHAARHDSNRYVYNGIDPNEFIYKDNKDDYILFLSKVSRSIKGVDTAVELAKKLNFKLIIAGGRRLNFRKNIKYVGEVDGRDKAILLAGAKALLFPIRWKEPFGLVVTEAHISGTPVITTNWGAMPELVPEDVGYRCDSNDELAHAIESIERISPSNCRKWALQNFTSEIMARSYLREYENLIR